MSFAFMPLYTGDYLRDTRHLTPMRHGIFMLALMYCWDSKGPMPVDEQECAGICNCRSADEIDALRYVLDRYFVRMPDGHYNKRMADEVVRFETIASFRREGGLRSAQVRRDKAAAGTVAKREAKDGPKPAQKPPESDPELEFNLSSASVELHLVSPSPSPSPSLIPNSGVPGFSSPTPLVATAGAATTTRAPNCPTEAIVNAYNEALPMLPRCEVLNDSRKRSIAARWREVCAAERFDRAQGIDFFKRYFGLVATSRFLTGRVQGRDGRAWKADLDFLMNPTKFARVIEGAYHKENH